MDICIICLDNNAHYQLCHRCYVCRYHLTCITNLRNHIANNLFIKCPTCRVNLRYQPFIPILEQLPLYPFSANPRVVRHMQVEAEISAYIRLVEDYITLDGENILDRFSHFGPFNDDQYRLLNIAVSRQQAYNNYKTFMHIVYLVVIILSMLVPAVTLVLLDELQIANCNMTPIKNVAYAAHVSWLLYLVLFFKIKIKTILFIIGLVEINLSLVTIIISAKECISDSIIALHVCKISMWIILNILQRRRRIVYENELRGLSYIVAV